MITCQECGSAQSDGVLFCGDCGFRMMETNHPPPRPENSASSNALPFSTDEIGHLPRPLPANNLKPTDQSQTFTFVIPSSGRRATLTTNSQVRIGRRDPIRGITPEIDLTPDEGGNYGVSRLHATIKVTNLGPVLIDLNSTNGTFLNNFHLASGQPYPLSSGDEIRFGHLLAHIFFDQTD